jgi:NAD(P)-dependent dehydrogenase (short-subunit alcohol dehydrogenase family)
MAQEQSPVWFITGCSTGFGRELAKQVLARGWRAVVSARDKAKVEDLVAIAPDRALALKLDVTDAAQNAAAVRAAEDRFGRIDVLVNNAGYGYTAAIEEGEDDQVRAMFETNFFGLAHLCRLVLPGMRKRRSGHIVNISSVGGLVGNPGTGYYAATKFAVEGLSDALSKELKPLGIGVLVVEPGPFRTDWAGRSLLRSKTEIEDYKETAAVRSEWITKSSGNQVGDPVRACQAIIKAVTSDDPPLRLVLGKFGLINARAKLESMKQDFDGWEETSLGADYPETETV